MGVFEKEFLRALNDCEQFLCSCEVGVWGDPAEVSVSDLDSYVTQTGVLVVRDVERIDIIRLEEFFDSSEGDEGVENFGDLVGDVRECELEEVDKTERREDVDVVDLDSEEVHREEDRDIDQEW